MCVMSEQILDCLKRKRDICIKNRIPSQNTAFRWTPALNYPAGNNLSPIFCKTVEPRNLPSSVVSLRKEVPTIAPMKTITATTARQIIRFLVLCSMFSAGYTRSATAKFCTPALAEQELNTDFSTT